MGLYNKTNNKFTSKKNIGHVPFHFTGGSYITLGKEIFAVSYRKEMDIVSRFDGTTWKILRKP